MKFMFTSIIGKKTRVHTWGPFTLMLVHSSIHVPMLFECDVVIPYTEISFEQLFVVHYFNEVLWLMVINIHLFSGLETFDPNG